MLSKAPSNLFINNLHSFNILLMAYAANVPDKILGFIAAILVLGILRMFLLMKTNPHDFSDDDGTG